MLCVRWLLQLQGVHSFSLIDGRHKKIHDKRLAKNSLTHSEFWPYINRPTTANELQLSRSSHEEAAQKNNKRVENSFSSFSAPLFTFCPQCKSSLNKLLIIIARKRRWIVFLFLYFSVEIRAGHLSNPSQILTNFDWGPQLRRFSFCGFSPLFLQTSGRH